MVDRMKMPLRLCALLLLLALLIPLTSCANTVDTDTVAVTILPLAGFVRAVAGGDLDVLTLVPAGASPETYAPTTRVMMKLSDAAVWFSVGVPTEETSVRPSLPTGVTEVALAERVASTYPDLTVAGGRDPHIWLSPRRAKLMVNEIAEVLSALYPDKASVYRQNAAAYCAEIDAADAEIRAVIAASGTTAFIVYHPAFAYLADEYGLTMYALEDEGREATAADLAAMVELARSKNIRAVFYQAESDGRQAEVFAREIGGTAVMLSPLAENYVENLLAMATAIAAQ